MSTWPQFRSQMKGRSSEEISQLWKEYKAEHGIVPKAKSKSKSKKQSGRQRELEDELAKFQGRLPMEEEALANKFKSLGISKKDKWDILDLVNQVKDTFRVIDRLESELHKLEFGDAPY